MRPVCSASIAFFGVQDLHFRLHHGEHVTGALQFHFAEEGHHHTGHQSVRQTVAMEPARIEFGGLPSLNTISSKPMPRRRRFNFALSTRAITAAFSAGRSSEMALTLRRSS